MKKTKRSKAAGLKLVASPSGKYSNKDVATVIGPELLAIAERHAVDLPQLTPKQVYEDLAADKRNPLWSLIDVEPKRALKEWVMLQIGEMIRSVRYEHATIPKLNPRVFESVEDPSIRGSGAERATVVTLDAYDKSGIAERIAHEKATRLRQAWRSLYEWSVNAKLAARYGALVRDVESALDEFEAHDQTKAAAE